MILTLLGKEPRLLTTAYKPSLCARVMRGGGAVLCLARQSLRTTTALTVFKASSVPIVDHPQSWVRPSPPHQPSVCNYLAQARARHEVRALSRARAGCASCGWVSITQRASRARVHHNTDTPPSLTLPQPSPSHPSTPHPFADDGRDAESKPQVWHGQQNARFPPARRRRGDGSQDQAGTGTGREWGGSSQEEEESR